MSGQVFTDDTLGVSSDSLPLNGVLRLNRFNICIVAAIGLFPLFGAVWFLNSLLQNCTGWILLLGSGFCGACVAAGLRLLYKLWRDAGVKYSLHKILRPSLRGYEVLPWNSIRDYQFFDDDCCGIYSDQKGMVIRFYVYADPTAAAAYLRNRLLALNLCGGTPQ